MVDIFWSLFITLATVSHGFCLLTSSRALQQKGVRQCAISRRLRGEFYNPGSRQWMVTPRLLSEVDNNWQTIVDCTPTDGIMTVEAVDQYITPTPIDINSSLTFRRINFTCLSAESSVFRIRDASGVKFEEIAVVDCNLTERSPIEIWNSSVSFFDCRFENNAGIRGGVISAQQDSVLNFQDSVFIGNNASIAGGGIYLNGSLSLEMRNVLFLENRASSNGSLLQGASGGGLHSENIDFSLQNLTLRNCEFRGNEALDGVGAGLSLSGYLHTNLINCSFHDSFAGRGGSLSFDTTNITPNLMEARPRVEILNGDFSGNGAFDGGVVSLTGDLLFTVRNSSFVRNIGTRNGGVISGCLNVELIGENLSFEQNQANQNGSVLHFCNAPINTTFSQGTFSNITCSGGFAAYGGCFYLGRHSFLSVRNSTFQGNSAGVGGGCMLVGINSSLSLEESVLGENSARGNGGSVFGESPNLISLQQVILTGGVAGGFGGGIYLTKEATNSPGLAVSNSRSRLRIQNSVFLHCTATQSGGAIVLYSRVLAEITGCLFQQNEAVQGGAILLQGTGYIEPASSQNFDLIIEGRRRLDEIQTSFGPVFGFQLASQPISTAILLLEDVQFVQNSASSVAGALLTDAGSLTWINNCVFVENWSERAGAVYVHQSLLYGQHSTIQNNSCTETGGGFLVQGRPVNSESIALGISQASFQEVVFEDNSAGNYGGALDVDGQDCFLFLLAGTIFKNNLAREGGALASEIARVVNMSGVIFENNRARVGGGAIACTLQQYQELNIIGQNLTFMNNSSPNGGAFLAVYNVHYTDRGVPTIEFDGVPVEAMIEFRNISFFQNSAQEGGAVLLSGAPAVFSNLIMEQNSAAENGGALLLQEGSMILIRGALLTGNEAGRGGSIYVDEVAVLHCIDCEILRNEASNQGGGISVRSQFYELLPLTFQCDTCSILENRAALGGGLHLEISDNFNQSNATLVALQASVVLRNLAKIGGGGLFSTQPSSIRYGTEIKTNLTASSPQQPAGGLLSPTESHSLQIISPSTWPSSWSGNSVEEGGYGDNIATYGVGLNISRLKLSVEISGLLEHQSGEILPPVRVFLVDWYGQHAAEAASELATISLASFSNSVLLSGQLLAELTRGSAAFNSSTIRAVPGVYQLSFQSSEEGVGSVEETVQVRECRVGEEAQDNGTLCTECEVGTYNFQIMSSSCQPCPEFGVCNTWAIAPDKDHWLDQPCSTQPRECLFDQACNFPSRESNLRQFLESLPPQCSLPESSLRRYWEIQCKEGYEGPLCGACMDGYGRADYECRECRGDGLILFLLFLGILTILVPAILTIRGNLADHQSSQQANGSSQNITVADAEALEAHGVSPDQNQCLVERQEVNRELILHQEASQKLSETVKVNYCSWRVPQVWF